MADALSRNVPVVSVVTRAQGRAKMRSSTAEPATSSGTQDKVTIPVPAADPSRDSVVSVVTRAQGRAQMRSKYRRASYKLWDSRYSYDCGSRCGAK